ncbi:uncharacterized protein LOC131686799 [Topomyia yanbarensis]|uniref:uncharacterized protein LOC131686799 n=1 Tax=Topomyia yanbarensis TaxID=2498891 RepID=UPI00273BE63B|nr:uncharacterized protein LOC131686799 [Topomyia yanbarensis]
MINGRLNFNTHVDYASSSILRYGGPVWIWALDTQRNRAKLSDTFRLMAMRDASEYSTISSETVCVAAGKIPTENILVQYIECYTRKGTRRTWKPLRADSMIKWWQD